ncbi:MAG: hypothetical protein U0350_45930 [Caldilineaceae bacterium]
MNQAERNQSEQLDRYLTARQNAQPETNRPQRPAQDAMLVDALLELATNSQPDPAFAQGLEQRLRAMAIAQVRTVPWYRRFPPSVYPAVRLAAVSLTLLCVVGATLFISVPTARATIWAWLYGFGLTDPAKVTQQPMPIEKPLMPSAVRPTLSLSEVRRQVPFPVTAPTWLPPNVQFFAGFVDEADKGIQVSLVYQPPSAMQQTASASPLLLLVISRGMQDSWPLVANQQPQSVTVQEQAALYVHGGWRSTGQDSQNAALKHVTWDAAQDAAWLSWHVGDLTYLLYSQDLGLQQAEMVRIAESLQ